jgi:hypothetical protein
MKIPYSTTCTIVNIVDESKVEDAEVAIRNPATTGKVLA